MLKFVTGLVLAAATGTAIAAQPAAVPDPEPPARVLVLGSFHFTGGGEDLINAEVDDFLSDRRQAEIAAVLDRLEAFAPTRILVELTPDAEATFNARYAAWRAGEATLGVNERDQLGMRLAARLGHDRLYAVDYQNGMDFARMLSAAEAAGQTDLLADFAAATDHVRDVMAGRSAPERRVLDRLRASNTAQTRELHDLYLILAQMGSAQEPAGADEMTAWWGRNLQIFANIARQAEPGERLLVIYGSGHKYLLDQFVEGAPNLEWVDALDYLGAPESP